MKPLFVEKRQFARGEAWAVTDGEKVYDACLTEALALELLDASILADTQALPSYRPEKIRATMPNPDGLSFPTWEQTR